MSRSNRPILKFAELRLNQLLRAALLATLGYGLLALLGYPFGVVADPADIIPLYGLFSLDEMGYRIRRQPLEFLICAGVLSLAAHLINALVF